MSKASLPLAIAVACAGSFPYGGPGINPYSTGASSKLPHDPERLRKAQERQAHKAARKLNRSTP